MPGDNETTLSKLKIIVKQFCDARDWDQYHNAKDLAIGITTESAELLDIFRFKSEDEINRMFDIPESREKITDEIADVLFFILRLSQKYDIGLVDAFDKKMAKNEQKYPVEKSRGSNKKYDEF
jgi:NTP pyrophosphatase (non-canonical NTP hydrolase)